MKYRFYSFLLIIILILLNAGCSGNAQPQNYPKRMIVLGIDGMDPKFLEAHWESLPNLDRLRREGEFKRLGTTIPPQSPVAWSTFITGMDPGGHGIYDFIHRNPETAMPYSSMAETSEPGKTLTIGPYVLPLSRGRVTSLRNGKAFWQMLAERHIPVNVIRMPTNFPPVDCEGQALSGMGTPDMRGTFGTFAFYTDVPGEKQRQVPGGQIFPVVLNRNRAILQVNGPDNTLRKDRARSYVTLTADVDPTQAAARFQIDGNQLILKQGEWSGWIRTKFELIPGLKSAAGMFRVYAKMLHPHFQVYISPINIDPAEPELPISAPEAYSEQLADAVGPFYTQGMAEDTAALRQGIFDRDDYRSQARLVAEEHLRLLRYGIDHFQGGLLFFHFFGVDQNSHMMWGKYDQDLLETYKMVDEAIGWVRRMARDAALIVMSDHGFANFDRSVHLNTWLMQEGFLALDDPTKTGNDELFAHVDWSRTQAYAVGLNGLYLNLQGREQNGTVAPADSPVVVKKIIARLLALKDPKTGEPVVETVYSPHEQFHGEMLDRAPDLIVGYRPGYRSSWQTALGAVPKTILEDNTEAWIGDHCIAAKFVPGVLLSNRKSRLEDPHLADLTVTILSEFGVPRGEGMIGRSIY